MIDRAVTEDARRLARLGVPEPAARAYAFLVRNSPATAREVAEGAGLHRSRAYGVLEDVEKLGLAEVLVGEPRRFVALPLAPLLDREIASVEMDVRAAEASARLLQAFYRRSEMQPEGAYGDLSAADGRRRTIAVVARAVLDAQTSVRWASTPAGVVRLANHLEGVDAVDALARAELNVRVILLGVDDAGDDALVADALDLLPAERTRIAPSTLPTGLAHRLVVDEARGLTMYPDPDDARAYRGDDTLVDTTIPALVQDSADMLDRWWAAARAVAPSRG